MCFMLCLWRTVAYSSFTHVCEPSTGPTDTCIPMPSGAMAWWNCGVDTIYGNMTPTPTPSVRSPGTAVNVIFFLVIIISAD